MKNILCLALIIMISIGCKEPITPVSPKITKQEKQLIKVSKSHTNIVIDGKADEPIWETQKWYPLDQLWLGNPYTEVDLSGKYQLT
jgi:hypothetical protein